MDAEEAGEARHITKTILKRSRGELWDAACRYGIGNLSKLGYHAHRQNATERGQRKIKDMMPARYTTQTAMEANRQHCTSMGAMACATSATCWTNCLPPSSHTPLLAAPGASRERLVDSTSACGETHLGPRSTLFH